MIKTQTQENAKLKEKLKTQGAKFQNSRIKLKVSANFTFRRLKIKKINVKMSFKGKFMLVFENLFINKCDFDRELVKTHANSIENCEESNKTPKNSSQKLMGAANPFVLFADSWSNF